MSGEGGDNIVGVRTVYDALLRLEGKVDGMGQRFDTELERHKDAQSAAVAVVKGRQDYLEGKLDGSIGMVKWLGPSGIVALLIGFFVMLQRSGAFHF